MVDRVYALDAYEELGVKILLNELGLEVVVGYPQPYHGDSGAIDLLCFLWLLDSRRL